MDVDEASQGTRGGYDAVRQKVKYIIREGYSATQILSQVYILRRKVLFKSLTPPLPASRSRCLTPDAGQSQKISLRSGFRRGR